MKKPENSDRPLLVLVAGLPGSGKTSFAQRLAAATGACHYNSDLVREAMGLRGVYDEAAKARVYRELENKCREALLEKHSVVVDATFYKKQLRRPYEIMAEITGALLVVFVITAPEEIIRQRTAKIRPHTDANFAVYQRIKAEFEPFDQPHFPLDSGADSLDSMVSKARQLLEKRL